MSMTYIGRKPCGCIRFAMVDNPEHKREVAKEIAHAIRDGLAIERVTTEYVRETAWTCAAHKVTKAPTLFTATGVDL